MNKLCPYCFGVITKRVKETKYFTLYICVNCGRYFNVIVDDFHTNNKIEEELIKKDLKNNYLMKNISLDNFFC